MVFFNHATRQMTVKIVYYGPGLCGKTTNLNTIYGKTSQKARGEMVSLNTETDRTLFFDLLPMDVGMVGGFKTKLQLYTVPGQVFYNSTRKLVLKGVDGIVFVVDSQMPMLDACRESYQNLEENIFELGLNLGDIPMVFQWNKRDLKNVVPVEELETIFNPLGTPSFQSVASEGMGVFETLRGITRVALSHIRTHVLGDAQTVASPAVPAMEPPHPAGEALTLSDLPSVSDLLDMEGSSPREPAAGPIPLPDEEEDPAFFIDAPVLPDPPEASHGSPAVEEVPLGIEPARHPVALPDSAPTLAPRSAKTTVKLDPMAVLASLQAETRRPAAKPKVIDHTQAIHSLLGELTQAGRSGAPSILRLEVPPEADGEEIEVVVQLRCKGRVLVEGQTLRRAPGKGGTAKLSVELKRV